MARDFAKSFYKSKEWQDIRNYCMLRDHHQCQLCGEPAEEVHHKVHLSSDNIMDIKISLNPDNLICLCRGCHFKQHQGEHGSGLKAQESARQLVFDENGYLIEDNTPPI